ncbi:MAG TPA: hypothetical protein VKF62_09385 [Planctomycetota bacterium]|nr:hypothetical protein [Planctomycetota bacterium]
MTVALHIPGAPFRLQSVKGRVRDRLRPETSAAGKGGNAGEGPEDAKGERPVDGE